MNWAIWRILQKNFHFRPRRLLELLDYIEFKVIFSLEKQYYLYEGPMTQAGHLGEGILIGGISENNS